MTNDNLKWKRYGAWRSTIYPHTDFEEIQKELRKRLFLSPEDEVKIVSIQLRPGRIESIWFRLNGVLEEVRCWGDTIY